jgi:uncharacterized protein (UPF0332 family)
MIDPESAASEFLQQAAETVEEARILLAENHSAGAINRSYYAAFYAACALLDSAGLKANSHQAAISLLHREFVLPGKLDRDLMRDYTGLFEARMSGDYGPFSSATSERAKNSLDTAIRFMDVVKQHLQI